MFPLRPLEEQFDSALVIQIREIQKRYFDLRIAFHPSRLFVLELIRSLEAGNLLAALLLGSAVLEMVVRETVIKFRIARLRRESPERVRNLSDGVDRKVEEARHLSFPKLVEELPSHAQFSPEECRLLTDLYMRVRVPLHHGLAGRYVRERSLPVAVELEELLGSSRALRGERFEAALEDFAVHEIADLFAAIDLVVRRGCAV